MSAQPEIIEKFISSHVVKPNLAINLISENLSTQELIEREALRRGLVVENVSKTGRVFLRDGVVIGGLSTGMPSTISSTAELFSNSKAISKRVFKASGIPIPAGHSYRRDEFDKAIDFFYSCSHPVVVKPSHGTQGDQVSTNITNSDDFRKAWDAVLSVSPPNGVILVEEHLWGLDIRAYVVGGKMVAACTRLPLFVVGNGQSTLKDLVLKKREERKSSAYLAPLRMAIDKNWMRFNRWDESTVLPKDKIALLNLTSNTHQGAANFEVGSLMCDELKQLAEHAAKSIPGFEAGGIDLFVQSLSSDKGAVVLEANIRASIMLHHYSSYGDCVNVAGHLLDSMNS